MSKVPWRVADRELGFEFLYTRWKAEDGDNIWKRRIARAMNHEIVYRCERRNHVVVFGGLCYRDRYRVDN
jgi:hypothetical protein